MRATEMSGSRAEYERETSAAVVELTCWPDGCGKMNDEETAGTANPGIPAMTLLLAVLGWDGMHAVSVSRVQPPWLSL